MIALPWLKIGTGLGVAALLFASIVWHRGQVADVRRAAILEQARLDEAAFRQAFEQAKQQQETAIAQQRAAASAQNKKVVNELATKNDRLGRDYADLRRLWAQAQAEAHPGSAAEAGTAAVSANASGDPFAAARAAGWVPFDAAATLAEAADRATVKHQAAVDWWLAQCRNWRGPKPEECE